MYKLLIPLVLLFSETVFSSQYDNLLYQKNDDMEAALKFISTPKDKINTIKSVVRGVLGDQKLVGFSNKIIEARETNNVPLFKSLTDQESLEKSEGMLDAVIEQLNDGSLIYGNEGYKYFVTSKPISEHYLNKFTNNTNKPSIILYFYHYHPSNGMLIGSPMYLMETKSSFKNILPVK